MPSRDCTPRALPRAARSGRHVGLRPPRNDKLGSLTHSPEIPPDLQLPKAVTDRRYRRNRLVRFYRQSVRIGSAFPRLPRAQSALAMTNLLALRHRIRAAKPTACKALNPRKGDAASVRRQSRQRLRSERRYRRNRLVRFYRQPVRIGSAFPRLPRAQSALAMTNLLALRHRIRAAKPTACKALTERCYRRNWCIPFSRRPVRIGSLAKLSTFHFPFSTRRMPSPYNAPSMPPPFPSASSHTCFASSTARGRRIIPARPNRR